MNDSSKNRRGTSSANADSGKPSTEEAIRAHSLHEKGRCTNTDLSTRRRQRMKWTQEMNTSVMRCYFEAKHMKGSIRKEMYRLWQIHHPDMPLNEQRIADQRRAIQTRKLLSDGDIERIREEVLATFSNERHDTSLTSQAKQQPHDDGNQAIKNGRQNANPEITQEVENGQIEETYSSEFPHTDRALNATEDNMDENLSYAIPTRDLTNTFNEILSIPVSKRVNLRSVNLKSKRNKDIINYIDGQIQNMIAHLGPDTNLTTLDALLYAGAKTAELLITQHKYSSIQQENKSQSTPKRRISWQTRIKQKISKLNSEIARLRESTKIGPKTRKQARNIEALHLKYHIITQTECVNVIERLQQEVKVKAARIQRYEKRVRSFKDNKDFASNQKRFFRSLNKKNVEVKEAPTKAKLTTFWTNIMSNPVQHNKSADWIRNQQAECERNIEPMEEIMIDQQLFHEVLSKSQNWKSPGPDKIQNAWLKAFPSSHPQLISCLNRSLRDPANHLPSWLTTGVTHMLPKNTDTKHPKNYRPITCLNTIWKVLTGCIAKRVSSHLSSQNIMAEEQKGCGKGSYGCKEQLIINQSIMKDAKKRKKELHMGYVDYQKAFDSVPHSWILAVLKMYKVPSQLINFLSKSMETWATHMELRTNDDSTIHTDMINIKRGIFQGDSLSPLLFCMSLNPLSAELNSFKVGCRVGTTRPAKYLSHLLYMDDLKLFSNRKDDLDILMKATRRFSDDIGMKFGLEKCATISIINGKHTMTGNIQTGEDDIRELEPGNVYRYLGITENSEVQMEDMKCKLRKEYRRRLRLVLQTHLNGKNMIHAINAFAVPVITYSFGVITWRKDELKTIDSGTPKLLTCYRMHHPKASVQQLYIHRNDGGRGLMNIENEHEKTLINIGHHMNNSTNPILQWIKVLDQTQPKSIINKSRKYCEKLNIDLEGRTKMQVKNECKRKQQECLLNGHKTKIMHGQYQRNITDHGMNCEWIKRGLLKPETEGFIIAAQNQSVRTKYYEKNIMKKDVSELCRVCRSAPETIHHILSECSRLASTEYTKRHNNVARRIHWHLSGVFELERSNWYNHVAPRVVENNRYKLLFDMPIVTDKEISARRPDIIVLDKAESICELIEVSVPLDYRVHEKTQEKTAKYQDLKMEIERMWHVKCIVIPVIVGALGALDASSSRWRNQLRGISSADIQDAALLGSVHVMRAVLGQDI